MNDLIDFQSLWTIPCYQSTCVAPTFPRWRNAEPFCVPSRNDKPPDTWDTHVGKRFL